MKPTGSNEFENRGKLADVVWYRRSAVQRRLRLIARLSEMRPREIAHRLATKAAKHGARWRNGPSELDASRPLPPVLATPTAHLLTRTSPQGFFAAQDREARAAGCRRVVPHDVERTLSEAEALLGDGIVLLGHRFRPDNVGFDWHADPERGRLWPLVALDDNDVVRGVPADVKPVWEVNRHQFIVTLARAHAYTGDERYAQACVRLAVSWMHANPTGIGVNWASNLEVAIRMTSWIWALHYLVGAPALSEDVLRDWLTSLRAHRDHVAQHLSIYTDATNHLIGEAAALALACLWLPELDSSEEWLATSVDILAREIERQVGADGISREQATSYQRYVLDWLLQVVLLAERNGVRLPNVIRGRVRAMLAALAALVGPGGRAPRIGDSDHARAIPFFTEDFWCFDEILALGSAVLGESPATLHESVVWATGITTAAPPTVATAPPASRLFREGGYAVLPAKAPSVAARLVFDCGPLGYLPHASHGHADLLSVLVDVAGEEMLIDPGTFAYWDTHDRRNLLRATRSHNTLEVGGHDQAEPFDPFMWLNIPAHGVASANLGGAVDWIEAWHDGYRRLRPAVRHRRGVLALPGGWLVIDWLHGRGSQRIRRWFHAAPGSRIETPSGDRVVVRSATDEARLAIHDVRDARASSRCELHVGEAPYSERYGELRTAPVMAFDEDAALPSLRVTALVPASATRPEPALHVLDLHSDVATSTSILRLRTPGKNWEIRVPCATEDLAPRTRPAIVVDGESVLVASPSGNDDRRRS